MPDPLVIETLSDDVDEVALAAGLVRDYCGWHIAPSVTETVTLDGNAMRVLALPTLHLTAVSAVTIDGAPITDFEWSPRGLLYRAAGWRARWRAITVTMTHGHTETPDSVRAVVLALARRMTANPGALRQRSILGYSETFADVSGELTEAEKHILATYRIPATP